MMKSRETYPPKKAGDELVGSLMGEIFVLPHYKPVIGANETVSFAPDPSNVWDKEAIRVQTITHPDIELVGYLEHKDPCVLHRLLGRQLIRIHGFVPEIAPAELHGVNVPCRIDVYSRKEDLNNVKSTITRGGLRFLSSSVGKKPKGRVDRPTATKVQVLGPHCGIFHNKTSGDVWDYIKEKKLQDPENQRFVLCDENLKILFNGSPRVKIPDFSSLIHLLAYTDKLVYRRR